MMQKGLEGVYVAESDIALIDGEKGELYYKGYPITELVEKVAFEDTVYLLLYGELPSSSVRSQFSSDMRGVRSLPQPVIDMIKQFPESSHPMELLQSSIAYLSGYTEHRIEHSGYCNCRQTFHQVAQMATVVATYHRFRLGLPTVEPDNSLSHGANFLYMLHGKRPDPLEGKIMDNCLILHAEHGMNASTFTARVVASSLSTCYCSIASAIGSLYGPLHGGANEKVLEQVMDIGSCEQVTEWVDKTIARHDKIMGMGHRVYKVIDPRARIMKEYLRLLSEKHNDYTTYNILLELERVVKQKMEEKGKQIWPNVDFFSGAVYALMNIPANLFTPIFTMSRVAGWLAHIIEQRHDNRIFRPKAKYVGKQPRKVPDMI